MIETGPAPPGAVPLPRRRRRWFTPTSAALLAITLGFAGFYAGVREEKTHATASTPATGSASRRSISRTPATGSAGAVTAGTVTRVVGDTVYVKEASGDTVQVKLLSSTTINKSQNVSSHSVRPGDSVAIQGTQDSGGTITSTSISDSGDSSTTTTSTSQAGGSSSTSQAGGSSSTG